MKRLVILFLFIAAFVVGFRTLSAQQGPARHPLQEGEARQDNPQFTVRVGVDLVNVVFAVTDRRGRFIPGLGIEDFTIEEEGRRQDIRHFSAENELPLTLAVLIDTSPSVRSVFDEEKVTATRFLETVLKPNDLALVIGFDRSVTLVQDFTDNTQLLRRGIDDLEIGGGTALYDAIYLASEDKLAQEAGRKAIILISDGEDTTSKVKSFEALVAAHQSDGVIYAIHNSPRGLLTFGRRSGDPGTLRKFAEETGGRMFTIERPRDFENVFNEIAMELRSQYSLGYVSSNSAKDGSFRRIRIIPRDSSHRVRARAGYYAPTEPNL